MRRGRGDTERRVFLLFDYRGKILRGYGREVISRHQEVYQ